MIIKEKFIFLSTGSTLTYKCACENLFNFHFLNIFHFLLPLHPRNNQNPEPQHRCFKSRVLVKIKGKSVGLGLNVHPEKLCSAFI